MNCLRCEIVRAKVIATGLAGLRKTASQIADDLQKRYGQDYYSEGRRVFRSTPCEEVFIIEARK